jgi:putative ATP-dependent endonuclease of the OLD family
MRISEVTVSRYRGWSQPVKWRPGPRALLVGPNNGGKTSMLNAIDLVLNPFRDAYRDRLSEWDYYNCDTTKPVEVTVILTNLSPADRDHFEPYLEGRREDGSFGGWDSPEDEFDNNELVLRLHLRAEFGDPSRAFFARTESREASVRQADKIRIGWQLVPANLDPRHELAFYRDSVLARLFERDDLSGPLDQIRAAIDGAKGPLLSHASVSATRSALQGSAQRLGLAPSGDPLDFAVAGLSDRRVLQSLQLVLQGDASDAHLPLEAHGRGVLRVLLLAAILQAARGSEGNLILAIEEPEQNLEPINQRLITRSLLFADNDEANQTLVSTHSTAVAGSVPLAELHLARHFNSCHDLKALREALPSEHKFFELHARSALVSGLYAAAVLLVEGPTERSGLPELWAKHRLEQGLDEHRIEVIDCESLNKMPSFVRFFRALDIPVIALCDGDKEKGYEALLKAKPDALLRWHTHRDWEGVLAGEALVAELADALEGCRASLGEWDLHADDLRNCLVQELGERDHLAAATDIPSLLAGYDEAEQRAALAHLMRGKSGLDFKSAIYARILCSALATAPPTVAAMIDRVHLVVDGEESALGNHDL